METARQHQSAAADAPPWQEGVRDAQAAGLASAARLRDAVAHAPIVLFTVDAEGIFTLSEGQGLEALGLQPGEHVGQSFFDLYGELPDSVATMRRALAGQPGVTVEHFRGLVFETRWMPTRAADGTVTGVIGVSIDITARARAEGERDALLLREQEARREVAAREATLAATFDAIADGILIYNRDGHLVRANAAAQTAQAWAAQSGHRAQPFHERVNRALPRDAAGRVLAREEWPVSRVLRGEVVTGVEAVDTLVRRPDGGEVLLSVSGAPIRDAEGRIVGGVIVDRDVTARRRLELRTRAALQALLQMAQVLVQGPPDAIDAAGASAATVSAETVTHRLCVLMRDVLDCRSATLIAMTPENALQPLACVGLSPDQEEQWRERIAHWPRHTAASAALLSRLQAGEMVHIDTTRPELRAMANPFGIARYLLAPLCVGTTLVGLLAVEDGHGDAAVARGAWEDRALVEAVATLAALVLERERLLREREEARASALALREANQRLDAFLGVVSHELRTPLTGLRGSLQLLQRRLERAGDVGKEEGQASERATVLGRLAPFLDRALHQSGVLVGLVDELLDLSRIQAGHLPLRLAPCELAALVTQAVEERRLLDPARPIALERPPAPVWVRADRERLAQVVDHYLDNALKYSASDQPVTVGIGADEAMARVWVRDAGPGIAPADQERLWERFSQVEGTSHRSGSSVGLGLGLYLSRTIIERHGGQVGVESRPGAGSLFWFRLPLLAPRIADGRPAPDEARGL